MDLFFNPLLSKTMCLYENGINRGKVEFSNRTGAISIEVDFYEVIYLENLQSFIIMIF